MILHNWDECTKGNLLFVRKEHKKGDKETEKDAEIWDNIYSEYIDKYGLSKKYDLLLRTIKKKALLEVAFIKNRKNIELTKIAIEEERLKVMMSNKGESMSIDEALISLSKWLGGNLINKRSVTAEQYFNLLQSYGKSNQKK